MKFLNRKCFQNLIARIRIHWYSPGQASAMPRAGTVRTQGAPNGVGVVLLKFQGSEGRGECQSRRINEF